VAIPEAHELCDAILQVWYPGCEGGRAVADVLFGRASPSGKLPVTVPRRTADLPGFDDYRMRGRTYRFAEVEPLYPFGFGLGYAPLAYGPLVLESIAGSPGPQVVARTTLSNLGDRTVDEAVQCYIVPPRGWPDAPRAVLVGFRKLEVAPSSTVGVEFRLQAEDFAQFDSDGRKVRVPGRFGVVIGSASPGPRAVELGAPAPAAGEVDLP
jgi:beta-glucosidase